MADNSLTKQFSVVAIYNLDDPKDVELADYITVAQKLKGGARDGFFMKDMVEQLDPSYPAQQNAGPLSLLTGTHKLGLRMSIVQATHEGVPAYLALLEDTKNNKLLVVGPQGIGGADQWKEITYVNGELYNQQKATAQVNDFLLTAVKERGEKNELGVYEARTLAEEMVKAILIMADLKKITGVNRIVPADTTVAQCLVEVMNAKSEDVAAYTVAGYSNKKMVP